MLKDIHKLNSTLEEIKEITFPSDQPFLLTITLEDVKYEFYINLKKDSDRLVVLGSGAYNSAKMSPPVFQRFSWAEDIHASTIYYNDPTLYLGKINLGWGQGTEDRFYLEELAGILDEIFIRLSATRDKVTFYGSSAGGFMSLYLAGLLKGTSAVVNNPQTIVNNYYEGHVTRMYECAYPNLSKEDILKQFTQRLNIIEFYKSIKYIPTVYYLQNLGCNHDVKNHLTPFVESIKAVNESYGFNNIKFDYYFNKEQGHDPLDQEQTLKFLNKNDLFSPNYSRQFEVGGNMQDNVKLLDLDTSQIIKISEVKKDTELVANKIYNNHFFFFNSLDTINFEEGIDWNYKHYKNSSTYQLYLHSLNVVSFLLNAYEKTKDKKYFVKSKEIIDSWMEFESTSPKNDMIWYDHPSAYRAQNLVYFLVIAKKISYDISEKEKEYISMVEKHANYLYSDKDYRKNNHGIMMDRSLIMLGRVLEHPKADSWVEKGIWRLKDTFYTSYSSKGVHLENSPEYHRIVRNLYLSTEKFLNKNDLTLGEDLLNLLTLSDRYFNYLVKPNGVLPKIGDTGKINVGTDNKRYVSFFDQTSGTSILQTKNDLNPENSTWMSFVCGYGTTTHKHYDDLSMNLFFNGHDILVDSGKYSYGKSKIRSYVISPRAHSTLIINDDKQRNRYTFDKKNDDYKNIYTTSFSTSANMDLVKGVNNGYENASLERAILFLKSDIVVIVDLINAEATQKVSQLFNLAPHIEVHSMDKKKAVLQSHGDLIEFEQVNDVDSSNVIKGDVNQPIAVVADTFGEVYETNQLEFNKEVEKDYYLTVVKLGENAISRFVDASFDMKTGKLTVKTTDDDINTYI
ncbi:MAG: heparinase II/III domain-containing protein [Bacillota bacterium]